MLKDSIPQNTDEDQDFEIKSRAPQPCINHFHFEEDAINSCLLLSKSNSKESESREQDVSRRTCGSIPLECGKGGIRRRVGRVWHSYVTTDGKSSLNICPPPPSPCRTPIRLQSGAASGEPDPGPPLCSSSSSRLPRDAA